VLAVVLSLSSAYFLARTWSGTDLDGPVTAAGCFYSAFFSVFYFFIFFFYASFELSVFVDTSDSAIDALGFVGFYVTIVTIFFFD